MSSRTSMIEAAATAWRDRDVEGRVLPHPAWADLDPAGRVEAYEVTRQLREMEAALDSDGLSTTGRAVLRRIRGA